MPADAFCPAQEIRQLHRLLLLGYDHHRIQLWSFPTSTFPSMKSSKRGIAETVPHLSISRRFVKNMIALAAAEKFEVD